MYILIRKTSKVRKRFNQVPHLTQVTTWESNKNTVNITNKSQEVSPFPESDHKAAMKAYFVLSLFWLQCPRNLHTFLVHSSLNENYASHATDEDTLFVKIIFKRDVFTSSCTQKPFNLRVSTDCTSQMFNIYLIECKRCNMQYVGQTNEKVSKLINSHRFDINNYDSRCFVCISIQIHILSQVLVSFTLMLINVAYLTTCAFTRS